MCEREHTLPRKAPAKRCSAKRPSLRLAAVHEAVQWASAARLANGSTANQGRVEILYQGAWAPVCGTNFGRRAAAIVCRQLGWVSGPATLLAEGSFGAPATKPLYMYKFDRYRDFGHTYTLYDSSYAGVLRVSDAPCAPAAVSCSSSKGAHLYHAGSGRDMALVA